MKLIEDRKIVIDCDNFYVFSNQKWWKKRIATYKVISLNTIDISKWVQATLWTIKTNH